MYLLNEDRFPATSKKDFKFPDKRLVLFTIYGAWVFFLFLDFLKAYSDIMRPWPLLGLPICIIDPKYNLHRQILHANDENW